MTNHYMTIYHQQNLRILGTQDYDIALDSFFSHARWLRNPQQSQARGAGDIFIGNVERARALGGLRSPSDITFRGLVWSGERRREIPLQVPENRDRADYHVMSPAHFVCS